MKFLLLIFSLVAILMQRTEALFLGITQLGPFQSSIVQGRHAVFNLCFPNGFPFPDAPPGQCYNEGFQGSISWRTGPCLPPIVNGKLVPPCQGNYVAISRYYNY